MQKGRSAPGQGRRRGAGGGTLFIMTQDSAAGTPEQGGSPLADTQLTDDELAFLHSTFDMARNGETERLLALVDQGLPADLTDAKGDTLMILAAYKDQDAIVRGLVERGADVNRLNDKGQGALTCAVFRQNEPLTRFLLEHGADPRLGAQNALAVTDMFGLPELKKVIGEYLERAGQALSCRLRRHAGTRLPRAYRGTALSCRLRRHAGTRLPRA
jgi:ankyrin repeat protein